MAYLFITFCFSENLIICNMLLSKSIKAIGLMFRSLRLTSNLFMRSFLCMFKGPCSVPAFISVAFLRPISSETLTFSSGVRFLGSRPRGPLSVLSSSCAQGLYSNPMFFICKAPLLSVKKLRAGRDAEAPSLGGGLDGCWRESTLAVQAPRPQRALVVSSHLTSLPPAPNPC